MFRSKKKLREQLQLYKERNIALTNALLTEKDRTKRYQDLFTNMKTAHQELRNKYENLQMKMLSRSTPDFMKKKPERG